MGECSAHSGREDIFEVTVAGEIWHENINRKVL
jgi:hypothetical protein